MPRRPPWPATRRAPRALPPESPDGPRGWSPARRTPGCAAVRSRGAHELHPCGGDGDGDRRRGLDDGDLEERQVERVPQRVGDDLGEALEQLELVALHDAAHHVDDPPVVDGAREVVALGARAGDRLEAHVDDEGLPHGAFLGGDPAAAAKFDAFDGDGQTVRHGGASWGAPAARPAGAHVAGAPSRTASPTRSASKLGLTSCTRNTCAPARRPTTVVATVPMVRAVGSAPRIAQQGEVVVHGLAEAYAGIDHE